MNPVGVNIKDLNFLIKIHLITYVERYVICAMECKSILWTPNFNIKFV